MRLSAITPVWFFFSLACADDSASISSGGKAVDASGGGDAADGGGEGAGDGGSGTTNDPTDDAGDSGGTTATGDGDGTGGDDGSDVEFDGPGPVITSSRVTCQDHGSSIESFVLEIIVDDPQGDDTIHPGESGWRVSTDGTVDVTGSLDCFGGWCGASLLASSLDSSCAEGNRLLWEVNIVDEDGNATDWTEVPWADDGA